MIKIINLPSLSSSTVATSLMRSTRKCFIRFSGLKTSIMIGFILTSIILINEVGRLLNLDNSKYSWIADTKEGIFRAGQPEESLQQPHDSPDASRNRDPFASTAGNRMGLPHPQWRTAFLRSTSLSNHLRMQGGRSVVSRRACLSARLRYELLSQRREHQNPFPASGPCGRKYHLQYLRPPLRRWIWWDVRRTCAKRKNDHSNGRFGADYGIPSQQGSFGLIMQNMQFVCKACETARKQKNSRFLAKPVVWY